MNNFQLKRYDLSIDKSLKAFSAADEYLLLKIKQLELSSKNLGIYNDRFGFLACHLQNYSPIVILTEKSQEKAINANLKANTLESVDFSTPLKKLIRKSDVVLIKMPKTLDTFQLFLEHISHNSTKKVQVIVSFMTRHFTPKMLEIAKHYFEEVEQSKALKKARLLVLKTKKEVKAKELINTLNYNEFNYKQYLGVFSAKHIDYATQYFLKHIIIKKEDKIILDVASGNGVIANEIYRKLPKSEIHLLDDSSLAVTSAKLNVNGKNIHHHWQNDLSIFDEGKFDLIVTNPPFHFEHEINIQIPIKLLKECHYCLKKGGNLQLVANKHLNYKTHLAPIFSSVKEIAMNEKFVVYYCVK